MAPDETPNPLPPTDSLVGPLSRLKGEYYRQLRESGVSESTASELVLNESLSKGALDPAAPHLHEASGSLQPNVNQFWQIFNDALVADNYTAHHPGAVVGSRRDHHHRLCRPQS